MPESGGKPQREWSDALKGEKSICLYCTVPFDEKIDLPKSHSLRPEQGIWLLRWHPWYIMNKIPHGCLFRMTKQFSGGTG
ncbi:hypothetical protein DMENIID0001_132670 [Sergentomyia squamirostris]